MFKVVLFVTFSVLCVVHSQSDDGCRHSRSYTRVKRGKYFPGPPLRFYNRPPMTFPIKGPFSYTPPPFMQDDEPPYPGSRPYKVTQSKSQSLPSPPSSSYSSSQSYSSSSTGLKPSPAAASIKAPPVEPAPPPSVAKEQSDAHLKAIKIWSHKSKGAAYTLHDDGTLSPEWPRPKYGK
ncbi:extensin-1-like [Spodoptera litura]|uniref:Extensin-1-like n=1 Tax=Spodoptera litura TaxID=69820 RepID=A0A9J7EG66_SPOLT|nr:extensin-1-like [Spodoptera litura]